MENKFKLLYIDFKHRDGVLSFPNSMFKLSEFMKELKSAFKSKGLDELGSSLSRRGGVPTEKREDKSKWFDEGLDCEILNLDTKGWQKGRIRIKITLEFCPSESEVSTPGLTLDDVRETIKQNSLGAIPNIDQ